MEGDRGSRDRVTKWLRRIARIWSFPIIVYSLIMIIGYAWNWATTGEADPYAEEGCSIVEALPPILIFISILGLAVAWRREGLGGAIAIVFQLSALFLLLIQGEVEDEPSRSAFPYLIVLVVAVPAILFLVCWWRSKKRIIPQQGA